MAGRASQPARATRWSAALGSSRAAPTAYISRRRCTPGYRRRPRAPARPSSAPRSRRWRCGRSSRPPRCRLREAAVAPPPPPPPPPPGVASRRTRCSSSSTCTRTSTAAAYETSRYARGPRRAWLCVHVAHPAVHPPCTRRESAPTCHLQATGELRALQLGGFGRPHSFRLQLESDANVRSVVLNGKLCQDAPAAGRAARPDAASSQRQSGPSTARGALAHAHGGPLRSRAELRPLGPRSAQPWSPLRGASSEPARFHLRVSTQAARTLTWSRCPRWRR